MKKADRRGNTLLFILEKDKYLVLV